MEQIKELLMTIRPEFNFETSDNYIEDGYLDSLDITTLISVLEETYGIVIDALEIVPENFYNTATIINLVRKSGGEV